MPGGPRQAGSLPYALLRAVIGLCALSAFAEENPVSYYRDVVPVFKRNCNACHRPGKAKGQLELTSFAMLMKGGKHGDTVKPGMQRAAGSSKTSPATNRKCRAKAIR